MFNNSELIFIGLLFALTTILGTLSFVVWRILKVEREENENKRN